MPDYSPLFTPGANWSGPTASVAVTGGNLLKVSGDNTVAPTSAITDVPIGVAAFDCAIGAQPTIYPLSAIHELVASAAVTAGAVLEPSTVAGQVKTFTAGTRVGVAATTFAGSPLRGLVVCGPNAVS